MLKVKTSFVLSARRALQRLKVRTEGRSICLLAPAVCPSSVTFPRSLSSRPATINYVCLYYNGRLSVRTERRLQIYGFSLHARVSHSVSFYLARSCKFCQSMIQNKSCVKKSFLKSPLIAWKAAASWGHYDLALTMDEKLTGLCSKFCWFKILWTAVELRDALSLSVTHLDNSGQRWARWNRRYWIMQLWDYTQGHFTRYTASSSHQSNQPIAWQQCMIRMRWWTSKCMRVGK